MAAAQPAKLVARLPAYIHQHLQASGLSDETIALAHIRSASASELPSGLDAKGYVIPFFDINGKLIPNFARIRSLDPRDNKYRQPAGTGQKVYLPPNVPTWVWRDPSYPLIVVEGEKKALKLAQEGFYCIGLTGVFSWRQRTYKFDRKFLTGENKEKLTFKFEDSSNIHMEEQVCAELTQLNLDGRKLITVFDTDAEYKPDVQLACFELCIWFYEQGAEPSQAFLPRLDGEKTGPDDFFVKREAAVGIEQAREEFREIIGGHLTFPEAPSLGPWINTVRRSTKSKRTVAPKIARAIIATMDANGRRYRNRESGEFYYLGESDKIGRGLHTFTLTNRSISDMRNIPFGDIMIKGFRVGSGEKEILSEVADLFATVQPIQEVRPRRVCFTDGDDFHLQVSDTTNLKVNKDSIEEVPNGRGVLFYGDTTQALDMERFYYHFGQGYQGLWLEALKDFELQNLYSLNKRQTKFLMAAVFHLSPWLRQWRGFKPPIEQAVAEAGSGKTFLYQLRRGILTGFPTLDAMGNDMKDWVASVTHSPGLWVGDNMNHLIKAMREDVQGSIARLVTEPDPHQDARALFSDNRQVRYPIDCAFAITTIRSPINQPDILQRSFVYHLRTIPSGRGNGNWVAQQLANREMWVAEHVWAVQKFLQLADSKWDWDYQSSHRLVNYEQSLLLMLQVLGMSADESRLVVGALPLMTNEEIAQNDPVVEALRSFAEMWWHKYPSKLARPQDIVAWATDDMEGTYAKVYQLNSPVSLGRWMKNNATIVELSAGLKMTERSNQTLWRAIDPAKRGTAEEGDAEAEV